jgi:GNAT superfamily N-acetyltransferase
VSQSAVVVRDVRWDHPQAVSLRERMAAEMAAVYADRDLPAGPLGVDDETVVWTGLALTGDGSAAGHAALRELHGAVELERMYVDPAHRGTGVARALLAAAHAAARRLGHRRVLLQTGDRQPGAVRLYERAGYHRVPIFAPYEPITFSLCMELVLPA